MNIEKDIATMLSEDRKPPDTISSETYAIARIGINDIVDAAERTNLSIQNSAVFSNSGAATDVSSSLINLGYSIQSEQKRLSKTRRLLATWATAAAFAVPTYALSESNFENSGIAEDYRDTASEKFYSMSTGGLAGLSGGMMMYLVSLGYSSRLAVKPAKRAVQKAIDDQW